MKSETRKRLRIWHTVDGDLSKSVFTQGGYWNRSVWQRLVRLHHVARYVSCPKGGSPGSASVQAAEVC